MVTATSSFTVVALSDPLQKAAMEHAFYEAFSTVPLQGLIREIWQWDDAQQRIALHVADEDVLALCWNTPEGYTSFYTLGTANPDAYSQFRYYGFTAPNRPGSYVEIFAIFRTPYFDGNMGRLVTGFLRPFCCRNRPKAPMQLYAGHMCAKAFILIPALGLAIAG